MEEVLQEAAHPAEAVALQVAQVVPFLVVLARGDCQAAYPEVCLGVCRQHPWLAVWE